MNIVHSRDSERRSRTVYQHPRIYPKWHASMASKNNNNNVVNRQFYEPNKYRFELLKPQVSMQIVPSGSEETSLNIGNKFKKTKLMCPTSLRPFLHPSQTDHVFISYSSWNH